MVDLTKWLVSGTAFATLCWRRDVQSAGCIFGAVLNALVAKILKRVFNAARPSGSRLSDPGMPSSHAQSLFFFASYLSVCIVRKSAMDSMWQRTGLSVGLFYVAALLARQRVLAGLHTMGQVAVGAGFGTTAGSLWFFFLDFVEPSIHRAVLSHSLEGDDRRQYTIAVGLFVAAALVVGSVERVLGRWLKRGRRAE